MQIGFIDGICLPCYEMLAQIEEKLSPLLDGCKANRARWSILSDRKEGKPTPLRPSMELTHGDLTKQDATPMSPTVTDVPPASKNDALSASIKENDGNQVSSEGESTIPVKSSRCCVIM